MQAHSFFPKSGRHVLLRAVQAVVVVAATAQASLAAPESVVAASSPARIVSLVPAITETLFALGLGERVVGVSSYCDFPVGATKLPKVGSFTGPVAEVIVSLRPDLVLTSPTPGNEAAVRAIERSGIRVAVVQSEGGLDQARAAMLQVAQEVGAPSQGEALVGGINARLAKVKSEAQRLAHPATAIVVGREPLVLAGPASYLGELLVLAGGINVADSVGGRWPRVGLEFLVTSAPDVLLDLSVAMGESSAAGATPEELAAAWAVIATVPAVANHRVVADPKSLMLRPGPRLADAAEALFAALHPEAVMSPNLSQESSTNLLFAFTDDETERAAR